MTLLVQVQLCNPSGIFGNLCSVPSFLCCSSSLWFNESGGSNFVSSNQTFSQRRCDLSFIWGNFIKTFMFLFQRQVLHRAHSSTAHGVVWLGTVVLWSWSSSWVSLDVSLCSLHRKRTSVLFPKLHLSDLYYYWGLCLYLRLTLTPTFLLAYS